jgi:hypothetical protein
VDSGLIRRDPQAHELWRSRRRVLWFEEFSDRIQLSNCGLLIDAEKERTRDKQNRRPGAPTPNASIRRIASFDIVDVVVISGSKIGGFESGIKYSAPLLDTRETPRALESLY